MDREVQKLSVVGKLEAVQKSSNAPSDAPAVYADVGEFAHSERQRLAE